MAAHTFTFHNVHAKRSSGCSGHNQNVNGGMKQGGLQDYFPFKFGHYIEREHRVSFNTAANTRCAQRAHGELQGENQFVKL